jgi:hypothetical protein
MLKAGPIEYPPSESEGERKEMQTKAGWKPVLHFTTPSNAGKDVSFRYRPLADAGSH